ncbi:MAG: atpF [Candidatus Saccharibacteria bacterium]|nr:atpF [Candidatus Saccharibacteria bacterium]
MFTAASHGFAAAGSGGLATLGIDVKALILQILTFVIVFWLLKKFALTKIIKTLEDRRETIDKGVTLGQEMEVAKAQLEEQVKVRLRQARAEADEILAKARAEASEVLKAAEIDATRKADNLVADAKARIADEVKQARRQLEQEMLDLVAEATEVIIEEKLDPKKDQTLIDKALRLVRAK